MQVIVRELLEAGLLNGDVMTCTGETLAEQVKRLGTKPADGTVIYPVAKPYKPTGGLRVLGGNLSPEFSAILKLAGVEGGLENNLFRGKARVFEGEQGLLEALDKTPERFQNNDMIIVRYEGPSGAPGMPEMLDPTSRITTLCRERGIVVALMTDARFSGGSVGLVIGHVGPEAALGGPIAFVEDGDEIVADLNKNELNCTALADPAVLKQRKAAWEKVVAANGGIHPNCGVADTRLLHRARLTAVPATRGGGLHPNREVWVRAHAKQPDQASCRRTSTGRRRKRPFSCRWRSADPAYPRAKGRACDRHRPGGLFQPLQCRVFPGGELARRREGDRHAGALRAATRIAASTLDGAGRGHGSSARSSALSGADRAPGSRFRGGGRSTRKADPKGSLPQLRAISRAELRVTASDPLAALVLGGATVRVGSDHVDACRGSRSASNDRSPGSRPTAFGQIETFGALAPCVRYWRTRDFQRGRR